MQAAIAADSIALAHFDNDPALGGMPLLKALRQVFGAEHFGPCEDGVCPTYGRMYFDASEDGHYFVMDRKDCTVVIRKAVVSGSRPGRFEYDVIVHRFAEGLHRSICLRLERVRRLCGRRALGCSYDPECL